MFDEVPRPNMVIRTRGAILGRTKVTSRTGDEDAEDEELSGEKTLTLDRIVVNDQRSHRA